MSYATKDYFDTLADEAGADRNARRPVRELVVGPAETERTPQEDQAANLYADELVRRANAIPDPATARAELSLAGKVRRSLPIAEFMNRRRLIRQAAGDVPPDLPLLEATELRSGLDGAVRDLTAANVFNPTLLRIMEAFERNGKVDPESFLGPNPSEVDRAAVEAANVILGLNDADKSVRPLSIEERVEKLVKVRLAPLSASVYSLTKDLSAFKAEQTRNGARFQ